MCMYIYFIEKLVYLSIIRYTTLNIQYRMIFNKLNKYDIHIIIITLRMIYAVKLMRKNFPHRSPES